MDKTKMDSVVDFLASFSFLVCTVNGLVLFFFLPGGCPVGNVSGVYGGCQGNMECGA